MRNRNNLVLALISAAENICSRLLCSKGYHDCDLETLAKWYPFGRLSFKLERAGKERVFAIPNALLQALLRPAHDWCMSVLRLIPMDGTYDQTRPLRRLSSVRQLYSFDLSAATDRFPLELQSRIIYKVIFRDDLAKAWADFGLGVNSFLAPGRNADSARFISFNTGQPLGFLSSGPLFALCHHILVWWCADQVYPGRMFRRYALLGDDIVIGDALVASRYKDALDRRKVKLYLLKSLFYRWS